MSSESRRTVLFDLDGTLFNSLEAVVRTLRSTFRALEVPVPTDETLRGTVGWTLREMFMRFLPAANDTSVDAAIAEYRRVYLRDVVPDSRALLFPNTLRVLDALKSSGAALAVVTNKGRATAVASLEHAGISGHFDAVVSGDDVPRPKPEPDCVAHALQRVGASASNAVLVGDTVIDVETARRASIPCVAVTHGVDSAETLRAAGAHVLAADLLEVLAALESLGFLGAGVRL